MTSLPTPPQALSRRDYFAAMALIGLSQASFSTNHQASEVAQECVFYADALIKELDKDSSPSPHDWE